MDFLISCTNCNFSSITYILLNSALLIFMIRIILFSKGQFTLENASFLATIKEHFYGPHFYLYIAGNRLYVIRACNGVTCWKEKVNICLFSKLSFSGLSESTFTHVEFFKFPWH